MRQIKKLLYICVFTTKCIFISYSQLISFCCVMVRKRSLQPSCIIVCVVTFCLYHGLEKKMLIFLIGPKESVDLVYPGG